MKTAPTRQRPRMGRKRTELMPMEGDSFTAKINRLIERKAKNMTETELAAAAGIDQRQLYKIRTGRTADPRMSTVFRLLAAIGARLGDLDKA